MKWLEGLYRKLWTRIGGRPWTYIIRDCWHKLEWFWITGLVGIGVWLGHAFDWKTILAGWLIFNIGYICGHLFWGTPYKPGQGEK